MIGSSQNIIAAKKKLFKEIPSKKKEASKARKTTQIRGAIAL